MSLPVVEQITSVLNLLIDENEEHEGCLFIRVNSFGIKFFY